MTDVPSSLIFHCKHKVVKRLKNEVVKGSEKLNPHTVASTSNYMRGN